MEILVSSFCSRNMIASLILPSSARPTREEWHMYQHVRCPGNRSTYYANMRNRYRGTTSAELLSPPWRISSDFPLMTPTSPCWRCVHRVCNKVDDGVNHPIYNNYACISATTMEANDERLHVTYIVEEPPERLSRGSTSARTSPQQ